MNRLCPSEFVSKVTETFPAIMGDQVQRGLLQHWYFSSWLDSDIEGGVILGHEQVAEACGKRPGGTFRSGPVLQDFIAAYRASGYRAHLHEYTPPAFYEGKCRVIVLENPPEIQSMLDSITRGDLKSDTRFMGAKTKAKAPVIPVYDCQDAQRLCEYMNSRPSNQFAADVKRNLTTAREIARNIQNEHTRRMQQRILLAVEGSPKPMYGPSRTGNTLRQFAPESIIALMKPLRLALCPDYFELDMHACHFAIDAWLASQFEIPEAQVLIDFLQGGRSVWSAWLLPALGIDPSRKDEAKQALKPYVYAPVYGMDRAKYLKEVTKAAAPYGVSDAGARLEKDPIIQALFTIRDRVAQIYEDAGQATDIYGRTIQIQRKKDRQLNTYSVLAQVIQAAELHMIMPAYDLAIEEDAKPRPAWQIVQHAHDGFSVSIRDWTRADSILGRIRAAVEGRMAELGVLSSLKLTYDPRSQVKR